MDKLKYWGRLLLITILPFVYIGVELKKKKEKLRYVVIIPIISFFIFCFFWGDMFSDNTKILEKDEYENKIAEYEKANSDFADEVQNYQQQNEKLRADLKYAEEKNQTAIPTSTPITTTTITPTPIQTPIKTPIQPIVLGNGNFLAGKDFPGGTYDISVVSGNGNVSSDNMWSGGINAIMGVSNDDMYQKEYKNIKLPKGTTLTITNVKIKLTKVK